MKDAKMVECIKCKWVGVWDECIMAEIHYEYENGEKEDVVTSSCPKCGEVLIEDLVDEDFDFECLNHEDYKEEKGK